MAKFLKQTNTAFTLQNPQMDSLQIHDSSDDHQYIFTVNELAADRNVELPLLASNDIFVFAAHAATLTNKTIDSDNNTITNIVNADIKSAAAIAVNKLAAVTASKALVSDGSGFISASSTTSTELGLIAGITAGTITASKAVIVDSNKDITGFRNVTATGLVSGGSLDIDDVLIDGATIGHTDDTDLITLSNGVVTVAGEISVTTLDIGGTNIDATAAEINIAADGSTSIGTTAVSDGHGIVMNHGGTMAQTTVQTLAAYLDDEITAMPNLVTTAATTVGALDSGSITSGFGTIDTGSSTITTTGTITGGAFHIGSAQIAEAELETIDGVTPGTVTASKVVVPDSNKDIASFRHLTATGTITGAALTLGSAAMSEADLEQLDGLTAGTVTASKAVVVDSNKDIGTFRDVSARDLTLSGNLTVSGTTTTVDTTNTTLKDNIIVLNSGQTGSGGSFQSGIEVERGDDTNVVLRWNDSGDKWEYTQDGSTYREIVSNTGTQTLSAKTLSNPVFTGIATADVISGKYGSSSNPITFTVKVITKTAAHPYYGDGSSSGYTINDVESPALHFHGVDNATSSTEYYYKFDQSDNSNANHPLRFYLKADKTGSYTTNVVTNGTAGSAGAYTLIKVTEDTPNILYYQCSAHSYMGNYATAISNHINHSGALLTFPTTSGALVGTGDTGTVTNTMLAGSIAQSKLSLAITTSQFAAATLVTESEGIGSNDNDTTLPTSAAVKDYVDNNAGSGTGISQLNTNVHVTDTGTNGTINLYADGNLEVDVTDAGLRLGSGGSRVNTILDQDDFSSDSATALATQQSIKAYVTSAVGGASSSSIATLNSNVHVTDTGSNGTINIFADGNKEVDITDSGMRLGGANSRVNAILDEDNMSSNSATALATQQSIKAYVDSNSGSGGSAGSTFVRYTPTAVAGSHAYTGITHTSSDSIQVYLNGVLLMSGDYSTSPAANTVTFSANDTSDEIQIYVIASLTSTASVTTATPTAVAGSNAYSVEHEAADELFVYRNGILLDDSDYTSNPSANTITLTCTDTSDELRFVVMGTISKSLEGITTYTPTAVAGSNAYSVTHTATDTLNVYLNGILLSTSDYSSNAGNNTVTLTATDTSDIIVIQVIGTELINTNAGTISVDDTSASGTFVGLFTSASGQLSPKTDANLTYDASTGFLTSKKVLTKQGSFAQTSLAANLILG